MSDARRRYRNKKRDDHRPMQGAGQTAPVTIARREDPRCVQPKILLKKDIVSDPCSGSSNQDLSCFPKTLIVNRCSDGRSEKCKPSGGSAAASGYHPAGCMPPSIYAEIKHRHLDPRCQRRAENWRNFGNDAN
ncbi:GL15134 [Drosophila persimilis]|uniref:GL15134 n=1 Tax=Drosophila persimilis TaxID=7234 RepID=B4H3V9_DROPE|nr:GL15134 [Drosophila persimilis]